MKSSSGFFLSHVFWRHLRSWVPGTLWSELYSARERLLSRVFIRQLEIRIAFDKPRPPHGEDHFLDNNTEKLERLWGEYGAVGKMESGYGPIYAEIIEDLPSVENVLELGVLTGGSHRAWSVLWPDASIYGLDIDPDTVINDGRITTYVADQLRVGELTRVAEKMPRAFELVVDDGWHQPEAGLKSLSVFLPRLAPGGYYVVEDIDWLKYRRVWERTLVVLSASYQVSVRLADTPGSRVAVGGPYGLLVIRAPRRQLNLGFSS